MEWSFSPFLQALGWATLNSFWQMALLWACFAAIHYFFHLSSQRTYTLGVAGVFAGLLWFVYTFFHYYSTGRTQLFNSIEEINSFPLIHQLLYATSIAYLLLLIVPAYKALTNWQYIKCIRTKGLEKAPLNYRLYVRKIASQLGIAKSVKIYISNFIQSPVTIGFLKPMILLPVAAFNNLSVAQTEAVLLHELAHIRRHDYLINLLLTVVQVILYFNPFLKFFVKSIEVERENCCDEMVLQFQYNRFEYASALLQLERNAGAFHLAMAAANSNHLFNRIQKIAGSQKKPSFNARIRTIVIIGLLSLITVNKLAGPENKDIPIIKMKNLEPSKSPEITSPTPNRFDKEKSQTKPVVKLSVGIVGKQPEKIVAVDNKNDFVTEESIAEEITGIQDQAANIVQVALKERSIGLITKEQQNRIEKTIENTKKVLNIHWKEVEKSIGEALSFEEKESAKAQYYKELEQIDWKRMQKNLEAGYERVHWDKIDLELDQVLSMARLDSIESHINDVLIVLNNTLTMVNVPALPFPDVSLKEQARAKLEIQNQLKQVQKLKSKKIIRI
jgi:beta-lactamase regulating signal transducer with metallopeptidase domain